MNPKDYSPEAMLSLVEYIKTSGKCANEPDETYGAAFIAMEPIRKRLDRFFSQEEIEAIIINMGEIRETLRKAGLILE